MYGVVLVCTVDMPNNSLPPRYCIGTYMIHHRYTYKENNKTNIYEVIVGTYFSKELKSLIVLLKNTMRVL